jgi:hypothetical protein
MALSASITPSIDEQKPKKKSKKKSEAKKTKKKDTMQEDSLLDIVTDVPVKTKKRASSGTKAEPKKKRQKKESVPTVTTGDAVIPATTGEEAAAPKKRAKKKKENAQDTTLMVLNPETGEMVPAVVQPKLKKTYKKREKDPNAPAKPTKAKKKVTPAEGENIEEKKKQVRKAKAGAPTITAPPPGVIPANAILSPRAYSVIQSGMPQPYIMYNKVQEGGQPRTPSSANAVPYGYQFAPVPGMVTNPISSPARKSSSGSNTPNSSTTPNGTFVVQQPYPHQFYPFVQGGNTTPTNGQVYHVMQPYQFHQPQQQSPNSNGSNSQPTTPTSANNPNIVFVNMNKGGQPMYAPTTPNGHPMQRVYFNGAPYPPSYVQVVPANGKTTQERTNGTTTSTAPRVATKQNGNVTGTKSNNAPQQIHHQTTSQQSPQKVFTHQHNPGGPVMVPSMYFNQMGAQRTVQMAPRVIAPGALGPTTGGQAYTLPVSSQTQILHSPTTRNMNVTTNGVQFINGGMQRPTVPQAKKQQATGVITNVVNLINTTPAPTQQNEAK